ncbi:hypothetical protein AAV94_03780 [Lampropedia cohaerens]|uniref:Uncharacterized protein n=1 Tax=Lampropedia cohaerens TaxID=1610491 RepID=A0A0U1Q1R2_9BURK|nr:hypothetical protein AAV94_03780 [Lampropedia cohaerens]
MEATRDTTYAATHWLASSLDGLFGDEPFENSGKVSGYLRVNALWDEFYGSNVNVRFRLRADLPNLEGRAYAFIGQDNEREVVTDQPENFSREQLLIRENRREDQSFFAGLGYDVMDDVDFRIGFRGGLNVYVQARYRNQWALSPRDTLFFRESLFWSSKDSLGSTTVLDYEHALSRTLAARWSTSGTITRRSDGFEWHSGLGLFKELPGLRTAAVEAVVQGRTGSVDISNYGVRTSWRQPIYRDWLLGKVTLGHFWPKERETPSREESWAIGLTVDMYF